MCPETMLSLCRKLSAAIAFAAFTLGLAVLPNPASAASGDNVVATIGSHPITEKQVDARIKQKLAAIQSQIYELKKQAIESLADEYLIEQAARKENLSADDYLKHHLDGKKITADDAKKFYDQNKQLQARFPKYDQIKDRLVDALENQREEQEKTALLDKLRKDQPLSVKLTPPRVEVKFAGRPEQGAKSAPVTIVEFSDFQCPFCKRAEPTLKQVREKYGDKVRLVYMDFPLGIHQHAMDAALAGRCAAEQGKFWPFHDQMFADQNKLAPTDLKASAKKLGLDSATFDQCLDQAKYKSGVEADVNQGKDLGVDGTPAFFINGRPLTGAQPFPAFSGVIDEELAGSAKKQARAD
jgi:protein-disulfide isomerase